ncbi:PAS domain-containing protein, partial [Sediminimonas sp.]|uniref:PAS domain-containing protein n=1 Tax=Sediminimonas sp. TaxID=2823379 RepID=UPI0025E807B9
SAQFDTDTTDTIVRLASHRRYRAAARPLAQIEAYWHGLRAGGDIPARIGVDRRGIDAALPHAFVLERVAPRVARLRVAGHALCDLLGMELRGMPLSALFAPDSRDDLAAALAGVFDRPATCRLSLRRKHRFGLAPVHAQAVLLPLRGPGGEISHAIGAIEVIKGTHAAGGKPQRFDLTEARTHPISIGTTAADATPAPVPDPAGFAEPAPAFGAAPTTPRLRLIRTES